MKLIYGLVVKKNFYGKATFESAKEFVNIDNFAGSVVLYSHVEIVLGPALCGRGGSGLFQIARAL